MRLRTVIPGGESEKDKKSCAFNRVQVNRMLSGGQGGKTRETAGCRKHLFFTDFPEQDTKLR